MRFNLIFILIIGLLAFSGCKTADNAALNSEVLESERIDDLEELANLNLNLDIAYLGSVDKANPNLEFMTKDQIASLFTELNKALAGSNSAIKFLYCEARSIFPETQDMSACGGLLKLSVSKIQFSFLSYNIRLGKKCLLGDEGCKIHQLTTIIDPSRNGVQRPPVFITVEPVPETVLLWTNHVVVPSNKGLLGYLEKFAEKDVFAPLVITPYNISKPFGMELGTIFGQCNSQVMNLVDFSNRAIRHYQEHRKSVVLTYIAANSALQAATLIMAMNAIPSYGAAMSNLSGPAGATVSRALVTSKVLATIDLIGALGGLPSTLVSLAGVKRNMELMKPGSIERKAAQAAIFLGMIGDVAGRTSLGLGAVKLSATHWQAAATSLMMVALVGGTSKCVEKGEMNCDARGLIDETQVTELIDKLREGNTPEVASSLCNMQKTAGLIESCPPPPEEPIISCSTNSR